MKVVHKKVSMNLPKIRVSFDPERRNEQRTVINSSDKAYEACLSIWDLDTINLYEEFKVIFLDRRNAVIGYRELSRGGTSATVVNKKLIFTIALQCNCSGFILVHYAK